MKLTKAAALLCATAGMAAAQQAPETATLPNGAIVNAEQLKGSLGSYEKKTVEVSPGVWAILGQSIVNSYVIEGDAGLIVYDTGDTAHEGEAILAEIRKVSDKPVVAILYSHAHYVMGAGALAEGREVEVIGNPRLNAAAATGGVGGMLPEIVPIRVSRAGEQFGFFLPKEGEDAFAGASIDLAAPRAFLPVNRPVEDGEEITVDGVRMQVMTRHWADSDTEMTVFLPDRGIALTNLLWPVAPNLYTPRGDAFRDAYQWAEGLRAMAAWEPEILLSSHGDPLIGRDVVQTRLRDFADLMTIVTDQTIRGVLKGLTPDELGGFVSLPDRLKGSPIANETYGELAWYPVNLYQRALGSYDGLAEQLVYVAPGDVARDTVALMGGRDAVLAAAGQAARDGKHAWAARLLDHLLRLDPTDAEARQAKADALRALSRQVPSSIGHNFLLSQALALEGKQAIPVRAFMPALDMSRPACDLVRAYRVRIDPAVDAGEGSLGFRIEGAECALEVRPGLAVYHDAIPKGAPVLNLSHQALYDVYRGAQSLEQAAQAGQIDGDAARFVALAGAFDWMPETELRFEEKNQ